MQNMGSKGQIQNNSTGRPTAANSDEIKAWPSPQGLGSSLLQGIHGASTVRLFKFQYSPKN
jgi:hypothetical protein